MPRLRVHCLGLSVDGFCAGPGQCLSEPMGIGGMALHSWVFPTRTFRQMHPGMAAAKETGEGTTGVDDDFVARGFAGIGAWILGRNMFGPVRGNWQGDEWKGWWGNDPPFHAPVFVLTHHAREPLVMDGGTTFHFVTGGVEEAYGRAMQAAGGKDVRLGGGANTIRQFLRARLVDHLHLAVGRVLLGAGEHLFAELDLPGLGYEIGERVSTPDATHVVIRRTQ